MLQPDVQVPKRKEPVLLALPSMELLALRRLPVFWPLLFSQLAFWQRLSLLPASSSLLLFSQLAFWQRLSLLPASSPLLF